MLNRCWGRQVTHGGSVGRAAHHSALNVAPDLWLFGMAGLDPISPAQTDARRASPRLSSGTRLSRSRPNIYRKREETRETSRDVSQKRKNTQRRSSDASATTGRDFHFVLSSYLSRVQHPIWTIESSNALEHVSCGSPEHSPSYTRASTPVYDTLSNTNETSKSRPVVPALTLAAEASRYCISVAMHLWPALTL